MKIATVFVVSSTFSKVKNELWTSVCHFSLWVYCVTHGRTSKVLPWCDCDRWLCWWCDWPRCVCAKCACARCEMCACASESASRPALPLPPLCVDEDEEEVEPRWTGPNWEGRLIQCSMPDMSSPGPASSSEPDDESEHRGDRPSES